VKFKRIDAFEIKYADSFTNKDLKLKNTTGEGEWRIYIGSEEKEFDNFFDFENVEFFFMLKKDLIDYLDDAREEYFNPSQEYRTNISKKFNKNMEFINFIKEDKIKIFFRKTYDNQKRYYLVLKRGRENRRRYFNLRRICLPRITRLTFVKLEDINTGKNYIYFKPIFYINKHEKEEIKEKINEINLNKQEKYRKQQIKYRLGLLKKTPFCIFTNIVEDKLLIACHIKPYSKCDKEEAYDLKNGIIMTPTYHLLFDLGFISFKDNGDLIISPFLSNSNAKRLNLINGKNYRLEKGSEKYLKYHRDNILNKIDENEINLIDSS